MKSQRYVSGKDELAIKVTRLVEMLKAEDLIEKLHLIERTSNWKASIQKKKEAKAA